MPIPAGFILLIGFIFGGTVPLVVHLCISTPQSYISISAPPSNKTSEQLPLAEVPTPVKAEACPALNAEDAFLQDLTGEMFIVPRDKLKQLRKESDARIRDIEESRRPFYARLYSSCLSAMSVFYDGWIMETEAGTHTVPPLSLLLICMASGIMCYRLYCVLRNSLAYFRVFKAWGLCKRYHPNDKEGRKGLAANASNAGGRVYFALAIACSVFAYLLCTFRNNPKEVKTVSYAEQLIALVYSAKDLTLYMAALEWVKKLFPTSISDLYILSKWCYLMLIPLFQCFCGCECRRNSRTESNGSQSSFDEPAPAPVLETSGAPQSDAANDVEPSAPEPPTSVVLCEETFPSAVSAKHPEMRPSAPELPRLSSMEHIREMGYANIGRAASFLNFASNPITRQELEILANRLKLGIPPKRRS